MAANHAEQNGPFIKYFLETINAVTDIAITTDMDIGKIPTTSGLYVFYVKFNPTSKERYPIYAGITRRTFRQRFKEHGEDGVLNKVWNGQFPRNHKHLGVYAYLAPFPAVTSKFLESVLLEAFDFCLNKDENVAVRLDLDIREQYKPEESKHDFDISWGNIVDSIGQVDKLYRHSK